MISNKDHTIEKLRHAQVWWTIVGIIVFPVITLAKILILNCILKFPENILEVIAVMAIIIIMSNLFYIGQVKLYPLLDNKIEE
jgi:hypothetical protein